jgi:hypothetical protein
MKEVEQLRLQAWLDEELSGSEQRDVGHWLASDAAAQALATELRATKRALNNNELERPLPMSGDFYWSRVQLSIQHGVPAAAGAGPAWISWWYKLLVPAGAAAVLGLVLVPLLRPPVAGTLASFSVETSMPDSNVIAFTSEDEGITVVWVDTQ